jgi:hypothetical protein
VKRGLHWVSLEKTLSNRLLVKALDSLLVQTSGQPIEIVAGANLGERLSRLDIDDRGLLERHEPEGRS